MKQELEDKKFEDQVAENLKSISPDDTLKKFRDNLEGMHLSVPLVMWLLTGLKRNKTAEFNNWLGDKGELKSNDGAKISYTMPPEHSRRTEELKRKLNLAQNANTLYPKTILVSYISIFDHFLFDLIKVFVALRPEVLNCNDKQISISNLENFSSISEAKDFFINQEIEDVLRKSHSYHIEWIDKTFKVEIKKFLSCWNTFVEITERRNLFVHTNGIISQQYLNVCRDNKIDISNLVIGQELHVSRQYLNEAFDCLLEVGIALVQVIWRKIKPDDLESADASLINVTYDLIKDKEYTLAKKILEVTQKHQTKFSSEQNKLTSLINLAQTYYHLSETKSCNDLLDKVDWSACQFKYKLCAHVLKEDFSTACEMMKKIGNDGEIKDFEYIEWPIFTKFRNTEEFSTTYKDVFEKDPPVFKNQTTIQNEEPIEILIQSNLNSR